MDIISLSDSNVDISIVSSKASSNEQKQNVRKTKSLQPTTRHEVEILTLSSIESSERNHQPRRKSTTKSQLSLLNNQPFCSPSPKSKVSVWLYKNSMEDFISVPEEPSLIDSDLHMSSLDDCCSLNPNKTSILVRQDYNKVVKESVPNSNNKRLSKINRLRNNLAYFESGSDDSVTFRKLANETKSTQSNTPPSVRNLHNLLKSMTNLCNEELPTNDTEKKHKSEIPISPETQKKNELCEYLKLMNMNATDKNIINMRQNRRSTRVQHLAIMTEKKELEKKLYKEMMEKEKNMILNRHKRTLSTDKSSKTSSKIRKNSRESSVTSKETFRKEKLFTSKENKLKINSTSKDVQSTSKSLQVPEISTTSVSKYNKKSKEFINLLTENTSNLKSTDIFNAKVDQVFNGQHKKCLQFNFNFALPKVYKVETDFEESIKRAFGNTLKRELEPPSKNESTTKGFSLKKEVPKVRLTVQRIPNPPLKTRSYMPKIIPNPPLKTRSDMLNRIPNPKFKLKSYIHTNNSKVKRLKQYRRVVNSQHVNKLRSRGRLKQVQFKTLLSKVEKKKIHKKIKQKHQQNDNERVKSNQVKADPVKDLNVDSVSLATKSIDLKYFETKINEINSELKYVDELTPEHVQALAENQKFLNLEVDYPLANRQSEIVKVTSDENSTKTQENCSTSCNVRKQPQIIPNPPLRFNDGGVITSEDLEVDELMSRSKNKYQNLKCGENKTHKEALGEVDTDRASKDDSRCTSISIHSTCSNCSMGSVQDDIFNVASTSKEYIEQTDVIMDEDVNKSLVEISSSTNEIEVISTFEPEVVNIAQIEPSNCNYVNPSSEVEIKSLHHYLLLPPKKVEEKCSSNSPNSQKNWDEHFKNEKAAKVDRKGVQSHTILLSNNNGPVRNAYYLDYNLIVVQELLISFWNQTPLGNILGAQDMWIPRGSVRRIVLSNGCIPIESSEMVTSVANSVSYVELWIKEHKSDKRERPVADIFVVIYFAGRSTPDKKVLQLENIHGCSNDVQYIVLRNSCSIVVSWNVLDESDTCTIVHSYDLSADYKTVTSIKKMQSIGHYVSSLHNIQDCDNLIMGCGNGKLTLCNIEYGYVVATIDLIQILPQPRICWAKCDRGFLFTLHQYTDGSLHLIAINSFDSTWKKLQSYTPIAGYNNLLGACVENGILVAFYDNGVLCWYAQSSDLIIEDAVEDTVFMPFGKYVTVIVNNQVHVRHALAYLVCED